MALDLNCPPQEHGEGRELPDLNEPCAAEEVEPQEAIQHLHEDEMQDVLLDLNEAFGEAGVHEQLQDLEAALHEYGVYADAVDVVFEQDELDDSSDDYDHHAQQQDINQNTNLTDTQRQQMYEALLELSNQGKLKKNSTRIVSQMFNVSEVMKDNGGNRYKVPHMNKARLEALGILPRRLSCELQLYTDVIEALTT